MAFYSCYDTMYALEWLADLQWLCTSELVLKHTIIPVYDSSTVHDGL